MARHHQPLGLYPGHGLHCGKSPLTPKSSLRADGWQIWISPIVENLSGGSDTPDGEAYHGYWAQNITEVNSNFGTESDLIALSQALHDRNMYLMVDVVTNHMGYLGCRTCVDYSVYDPFNSVSLVLSMYSNISTDEDKQSYFHTPCAIDYNNDTSILICWEGSDTVSLPDLRTEDSDVLDMFNTWISGLVQKYSIDGLRLDSVREVDTASLAPFESACKSPEHYSQALFCFGWSFFLQLQHSISPLPHS
jgi:alpha-amylase